MTGAAGGFSSATVRTLADAGAHVVVFDIDTAGAEWVAADLPSAIAAPTTSRTILARTGCRRRPGRSNVAD